MAAGYSQGDPLVILIADDELLVRSMVEEILEGEGRILLTARDGIEALRVSREYPRHIDLLLSDMDMPELSGLELARQLLLERKEIKILLTSGAPLTSGTRLPFLSKPFTVDELLAKVQEVLGGQPQSVTDIDPS